MTDDDSAKPFDSARPSLDATFAEQIVGKRLLVGLTYLEHSGDLIEHLQLHGIVEEISIEAGILMRLPDGSTFRLPPDLTGVEAAPPGTYRLRSTGEEVEDPDFLYTWTITRPPPVGG